MGRAETRRQRACAYASVAENNDIAKADVASALNLCRLIAINFPSKTQNLFNLNKVALFYIVEVQD